ncbi:MAG TPA: hypothetical protein VHF50_00715 [Solirubrobacterales bacterium]|nr:hypothetical protein [Solirubrobacterales bacterium]
MTGGLFDMPGEIAVRESTGQVYVVDRRNHRIQRFDSDGNFELAWGRGVVAPGGAGDEGGPNEVQTITATGEGSFAMRFRRNFAVPFEVTSSLPRSSSAAAIESALEALPSIAPADVGVTGPVGGPWAVEFGGDYAGSDVPEISHASGTVNITVKTTTVAGTFEICSVASQCRAGAPGSSGGDLASPTNIAVDQASGDVYVFEFGNARISRFQADGTFVRTFGWDVLPSSSSANVPGNERQTVTLKGATGGTFQLLWSSPSNQVGTTTDIPYNASAVQLQSALEGLTTIAPGDVSVTGSAGGPWTVEFTGSYADVNVSLLVAIQLPGEGYPNLQPESPSPQIYLVTSRDGGGYEVCTNAPECRRGAAGVNRDLIRLSGSGGRADAGAAAGQLGTESVAFSDAAPPNGPLAVDAATGDLYVGSLLRINHFEADGSFVRAFGWGVDTGSDQFEVCTAASGCEHALRPQRGTPEPFPADGQMTSDPRALALAGDGVLYAAAGFFRQGATGAHQGPPFVFRFDTTETSPGQIFLSDSITEGDPPPECNYCVPGPLPHRTPAVGLEVDPGTGRLFHLGNHFEFAQGSAGVLELDPAVHPAQLVETHFPESGLRFSGLGLNATLDRLYLSGTGSMQDRILVLGTTAAPPPTATIEPVSDVTADSATFHGKVTPNGPEGIQTRYRFEYSPDGTTWARVPVPAEVVGDGAVAVPVSEAVVELEANTQYTVRLVAIKDFNLGTVTSGEVQFTTPAIPPSAKTLFPQARTASTATLAALIAANNSPTSYRFEYGQTTAYGAVAPVPDGLLVGGRKPRLVLARVTGLVPGATYHYRVVADNGVEVAPGETTVTGDDVAFTTRPAREPREARGFEMVTPPFKVVRSVGGFESTVRNNPNTGVPSLEGSTVLWQVPFFPLTDDVGWPANGDRRIIRRTSQGWVNETLNTLGILPGTLPVLMRQNPVATSGDLESATVRHEYGVPPDPSEGGSKDQGGILPVEGNFASRIYTFRKGSGVEGFTSWLTNPERQVVDLGADINYGAGDRGAFNDDGTVLVRSGTYGGLEEDYSTPADEDPSDNQELQGAMTYLQRADDPTELPSAPKDLVNECTGSGAAATRIVERTGGGLIAPRQCTSGKLTHLKGGVVGGAVDEPGTNTAAESTQTSAASEDGNRIFFTSPDPQVARTSCDPSGSASLTSCPPQLFVRQYDQSGTPTVRWLSHSRSIAGTEGTFTGTANPNQLIANQSTAQLGMGTAYLGASRKGDVVYFQTNAPLVPTDPNGGNSITAGVASESSWDLYRYELPAGLDADPDTGVLFRITGGPAGNADPNTNGGSGGGSSLRYMSDDGQRIYFVTRGALPGVDLTPPAGGATTPGGSATTTGTRNLYLYDANASGADRYRFVARLPAGSAMADCASTGTGLGGEFSLRAKGQDLQMLPRNCFRGTADGQSVAFFTDGQLTEEDTDTAGDVYFYDAATDELVRVSAPPPGVEPFVCLGNIHGAVTASNACNGEFGHPPDAGLGFPAFGTTQSGRGWGGMRYYNVSENPDGTVSVFFESKSELVPEDVNGAHYDVYEWREGELSLISPGNTNDDSWFSGNSVDGRDVFIWTSARIDPREIDEADFDIYDARRGSTGFPYTPPPVPCDVLGLGCEGEATPPPPTRGATSPSVNGPGNVAERPKPRRCAKGKLRRKGRCVKASAKKGKKRRTSQRRKGGRR